MTMGEGGRNPPDLDDNLSVRTERQRIREDKRPLTGSIEQAQGVGILSNHDSDSIIVEHL